MARPSQPILGFSPCGANLEIPAPTPLRGEDWKRAMRLPARSVQDICAVAQVRCRVSGAISPQVVLWNLPHHGYTEDELGVPRYAVSTQGLPQRKQQRALRVLEILAFGFQDYVARESVCGRVYFLFPITPDSGRIWLAEIGRRGGTAHSQAKALTSAANGRLRCRSGQATSSAAKPRDSLSSSSR